MNFAVLGATFVVVAVAELPDKTFFASVILATRYRPLAVWVGATLAFLVHVTIAVLAGRALALLPHVAVDAIAAALFFVGALVMWFGSPFDDEPVEAVEELSRRRVHLGVVTRAFLLVFVAEWGDVTQILTANLTARYESPLSVAVGAAAALAAVAALATTVGRVVLRVAPVIVIRRVGAGLLLALSIISAVAAVNA